MHKKLIVFLIALLSLAPVFADAPRSLFIAPFPENAVHDSINLVIRDDQDQQSLRAHCARKKKIWIWPNIGPLSCLRTRAEDTIATIKLTFSPALKMPWPDGDALVSTRPFPKQHWVIEKPTVADLNAAWAMSELTGSRRKMLKDGASVRVLKVTGSDLQFLILPYRFVKSAASDDGEGDSDHTLYKIYVQVNGGRWKPMYELAEFPVFVGDLNGDGVPEIRRQPYCDGDCTYYDSFYPVTETLVEFNVHG